MTGYAGHVTEDDKSDAEAGIDEFGSALEDSGENSDEDLSASDHVRVVVRCRPLNLPKEKDGSEELTLYPDGKSILVTDKKAKKSYRFTCVADPSKDQVYMFRKTGKHVVDCVLAGFNGAIVAYGQTGSGKTYTMQGPGLGKSAKAASEKGIIQMVCETIFAHKEEQEKSDSTIKLWISASYLEIYNDTVVDLLVPVSNTRNPGKKQRPNLSVFEAADGQIIIPQLKSVGVKTSEDCYVLLKDGGERRVVGATNMNAQSSRSHAIFTLQVERLDKKKGVRRVSKLHLVDLAGSERQKGSGAKGLRLKEASGINKSLSCLGNVISALTDREKAREKGLKTNRIPSYRDSRLTFVLKDSFGGNSKLCLIATITPAAGYADETANTLDFAKRCSAVRNEAVVNEHLSQDIAKLQAEVRRLQNSEKLLRVSLSKAKNTEMELRASNAQIHTYPVHVRSGGTSTDAPRKKTKEAGVQTEENISPFDEGKDILKSVKTKDLTNALDSLAEGALAADDKETRTEKLCLLLTNAISREKYHQRKGEEMQRKIEDSHKRWVEMLEINEELMATLKTREKALQDIAEMDMEKVHNGDGASRRMKQELELLRVRVANNPDTLLLRHRVAALESDLQVSNEVGNLTGEARGVYEKKVHESQSRWLEMLNINGELLTSLQAKEKELREVREKGIEQVYGADGKKLWEELELVRVQAANNSETVLLRNRIAALEKELVEFAEISMAAQQEALDLSLSGKDTAAKDVSADFSTDLDDIDEGFLEEQEMGVVRDSAGARDKENRPCYGNRSASVKKRSRKTGGIFSKNSSNAEAEDPAAPKQPTAEDVLSELLKGFSEEEVGNLDPKKLSYAGQVPRRRANVPEVLVPLENSVRKLESFVTSVDTFQVEA